MGKALRWFIAIVGGLALLAIALFAIARLRGPDREQKAAIALLEKTTPHVGRNAFALLWLLPYDVPQQERERVLAEDVARFQKAAAPATGAETFTNFASIAEKRYPAPNATPERERYCKWRDRECLAKVRAEPAAYARLLEADAALIARADTIATYGYVRSPFPPRLDTPIPAYQFLAYPLTRHAYAFATGDLDGGLDGVCRGVSAGRMMIRDGENLISSMIGTVMLQGNSGLLADMLAELPADHPLPASCAAAFVQAAQDEFSACSAMRGEARFIFGNMRHLASSDRPTESAWQNVLWPVFYDHDKTIARMAPALAWYCSAKARSLITADIPAEAPPAPTMSQQPLACFDNFAGCVLADIASPHFDEYQRRLQDAGMRLKLTATLLWLRDHPDGRRIAERLAQRPAALHSPTREPQISKDGTSLSVELFNTRHGERWSVPLPASRRLGQRGQIHLWPMDEPDSFLGSPSE